MAIATTWNTSYEESPAGSDSPVQGDDQIRALKLAVRERGELEHVWGTSEASSGHGWHREGSAKAYYEASAPTNRPDGATALTSDDAGRLWFDSDNENLKYYTGSAWADPDFEDLAIDDTLTVGGVTTATGSINANGGIVQPLYHIQDQKASQTAGGTFTSGAWQTRTINTEVSSEISGASLSSNQITLPAGTYYIEWSAPACDVHVHKTLLYNVTDASIELIGTQEISGAGDLTQTRSFGSGKITITGTKVFELRHKCYSTKDTSGFGLSSSVLYVGEIEIYSDIKIWKQA